MFDANFAIFEPETSTSVRLASTLSFSPWMRTVPFFSRRYSLWLDIVVVFGCSVSSEDARIIGIARDSRTQGMGLYILYLSFAAASDSYLLTF